MSKNYLCIFIPDELQQFSKIVTFLDTDIQSDKVKDNFGVKIVKDENGNVTGTAHYSASGELIKKIIYNGSSVASIEHYRNNRLFSTEKYDLGKLLKKVLYSANGEVLSTIGYKYNKNGQIVYIEKLSGNLKYSVEYGYDDLMRVNGRILKINNKTINEQFYKYDILDRIVEYSDCNQHIDVHKVNQNNELISYTITDAIGNKIIINNKYMCTEYIGTDIELNGHKTTLKDRSYVSNIMLKRPFTSEDDLDSTLSNLIDIPKISVPENMTTKREHKVTTEELIDRIIKSKEFEPPPPISADKIKYMKF